MKKILSTISALALIITMIPFQASFADNGNTKVTVNEKAWVGNLEAQQGSLITLEEIQENSWRQNDTFVLRLPEGVTWNRLTRVNGRMVASSDISGRDLTVRINATESIDRTLIQPSFDVNRSVSKGDLNVIVQRGDVSSQDRVITIAEVKDYGAKISVPEIENISFGDPQSKEIVITLEEFVEGSLLRQTGYELVLENATIDSSKNITRTTLDGARNLNMTANTDSINFSVDNGSGKGKWQLRFSILPENEFTGDINLSLRGREVEDVITIARVDNQLSVTSSTPTNIALGFQNQDISSIEIRESSAGSLAEGTHAIKIDPEYAGMTLTSGDIEVTSGNIRVRNLRLNDGIITFDVNGESTSASTIRITGLQVTIDQFGYLGDYKGIVLLNYDTPSETKVGEITLFNATAGSPVDGTARFVGTFVIGNPTFVITTSGINRTETFDVAPYIEDSRTMLSVAAASLALDATVAYDHPTRTVVVESGNSIAKMTIGSNILDINGETVEMDTPAVIRNNRTFIPLAYLAQVLDADLVWDANTRSVTLTRD